MSVVIYLYDTYPRDVVVGYGPDSLGGWVKRLQTGTEARNVLLRTIMQICLISVSSTLHKSVQTV
jgi:hypothetical protein